MADPSAALGGKASPQPVSASSEPRALDADCEPPVWEPVEGTDDGIGSHLANVFLRAFSAAGETVLRAPLLAVIPTAVRVFARGRSRVAEEFLRQALGELSEEEVRVRVRQAWRHMISMTLDEHRRAEIPRAARPLDAFTFHIAPSVREALGRGGGRILITPHLGDWEAFSIASAHMKELAPVFVISKPPRNRPLSIRLQRTRESYGLRLLHRKGAAGSAAAVLRTGGTLGLLLDQRARKRAVMAPFFGRPAACERAAAVLIKRHRVPVIIGCCLDGEDGYEVHFPEVLTPEEIAGASLVRIVTRINRAMERMILANPEQYLWLHDRFRPPSASPAESA